MTIGQIDVQWTLYTIFTNEVLSGLHKGYIKNINKIKGYQKLNSPSCITRHASSNIYLLYKMDVQQPIIE